MRVRIGRADRPEQRSNICDPLPHHAADRLFPDYDELYWNATGTGWTFPIDVAEARINLPEQAPFKQTAIYTGPQGATRQGRHRCREQPGRIVFRTTRPLPVAMASP